MSKPGDNEKVKAKADRTASIVHMQAALKESSDRWEKVCEVYTEAWDKAFDALVTALQNVKSVKDARAKAIEDRWKTCIGLACVFLPVIGGEMALALAPIISTRTKLFVSTMEKKAQAAWTGFAANRPIVSLAVKEVGSQAGSKASEYAKEAAEAIQKEILEKLTPKYGDQIVPPPPKTPVQTFKDNNDLIEDRMNGLVKTFAEWNLSENWRNSLVPVAHDMFMNHPWIKTAPKVEQTMAMLEPLKKFIELALWFRWARTLDEPYWTRVHDWYVNENLGASMDARDVQARGRARLMSIDSVDFRFVFRRLQAILGYRDALRYKMKILDPESGMILAEQETIDMFVLIRYAKSSSHSRAILAELVPSKNLSYEFFSELKKL
jgi:hypothetical protein